MAGIHTAEIRWARGDAPFTESRYSRLHAWRFDGGVEVPACAAPGSAPPPFLMADAVDPEEALVASLASCHMLFFLALASKAGFVVESYVDRAEGVLGRNERGRTWMKRITLRPEAVFSGEAPPPEKLAELHERSHSLCYIANSLKSEVVVEPVGPAVSG